MARKKWQLRYRTTSAVDNFPSERKAYAFIQDLARAYAADPEHTDPRVYVFVEANTYQQDRAAALWDRNHPKVEQDVWLTRADVLLAVIAGKEG